VVRSPAGAVVGGPLAGPQPLACLVELATPPPLERQQLIAPGRDRQRTRREPVHRQHAVAFVAQHGTHGDDVRCGVDREAHLEDDRHQVVSIADRCLGLPSDQVVKVETSDEIPAVAVQFQTWRTDEPKPGLRHKRQRLLLVEHAVRHGPLDERED